MIFFSDLYTNTHICKKLLFSKIKIILCNVLESERNYEVVKISLLKFSSACVRN